MSFASSQKFYLKSGRGSIRGSTGMEGVNLQTAICSQLTSDSFKAPLREEAQGTCAECSAVNHFLDTSPLLPGGFEDAKHKEDIYFEIIEPETLHYTFKVRPAQDFGVPFNDSLHNVGLVVAEPAHGCSAPINKLELRNNIALIERGGCSFLSKCIQAERSGVLAVMICDNDISNDDQYIDMIDDSTKRNCSIPAVFLLGKDGYMIKKSLKTHNLTRAIINIPINMTFVPNHEHRQPPWVLW